MSGLCRHSPSLLLLDEPTSGLDSRAALFLLTTLRQLAKTRAVALTIHQPGGKLWALLHQATLLSAQGEANNVHLSLRGSLATPSAPLAAIPNVGTA